MKFLAKNWHTIVVAVVVSVPLLVLTVLLVLYAVNVPFWDQWEFVTIIQKAHDGTLGFGDFFAQHNEHRILFPRLVMFVLAFASQWNTLWEVGANVVLAAATMWFLYLILRRTFASKKILVASLLLTNLILFSPIQFENWMWGWQIQWYLNVLGLVVAIWALGTWQQPRIWLRVLVGAIAAAVATYSLASGMFVWLICLPLLWFNKDIRTFLLPWVGVGSGVVATHYIGYQDPAYHPSKLLFLQQPKAFVEYFFIYTTRPVAMAFSAMVPFVVTYWAIITGVAGTFFVKFRRELTGSLLPWVCLALYSLAAAVTTDLSRLGFGLEQAYSSRYITLSSLLLIAVCIALFKLYELQSGLLRKVAMVVLVAITLLVGANWHRGIEQMQERHDYLLKVQQCAHTATSVDDPCLLTLYPNAEVVWSRLQYLRSIHWGGL